MSRQRGERLVGFNVFYSTVGYLSGSKPPSHVTALILFIASSELSAVKRLLVKDKTKDTFPSAYLWSLQQPLRGATNQLLHPTLRTWKNVVYKEADFKGWS